MSDQEREPTPDQEAAVRRLLAEARHDEPMPGDVAARLDRVLERLADHPDDDAGHPVADELAARRRRRRLGSLLVAAAAVVAVGVGIGQVLGPQDDGVSSSNENTAQEGAGAGDAPPEAAPSLTKDPDPGVEESVELDGLPLRAESFARDVRRYRKFADGPIASGFVVLDETVLEGADLRRLTCVPARFGQGRLLPVLYDQSPAVLAYRQPAGDTQVVELLQCGSGVTLRSITLPFS